MRPHLIIPFGCFDAAEWAKAICAKNPVLDEGTMRAWFSCAIMTGFDHARQSKAAAPQPPQFGKGQAS